MTITPTRFTFGVNWYLNYWVKYQLNVNIDQLKQPSITGQVPQNFFVIIAGAAVPLLKIV